MNSKLTGYMGAAVVAGGMLLSSLPVSAYQSGDLVLRAGAAGVLPTGESETISAIAPGAKVEADDDWSLGLTGTYMFTDQIGVGVLAAWPFEHDIDTEADLEGVGKFDVDIDPWVVMIGVGKKF